MAKPATVRALALGGTWETIGSDRTAGIWVENLQTEYDEWGPAKCTFDVRRHSGRPWPDIGAFAPIDVEIAGVPVFSGRVNDTPARDGQERVMSVQVDGPQFHLDDDLFERLYVHTKVSEWRDVRSFSAAPLNVFTSAPQVSASDGLATLAFPANVTIANLTAAGIGFDFGTVILPKFIWVDYDYANPTGNANLKFEIASASGAMGVSGTTLSSQSVAAGPGSRQDSGSINSGNGDRYVWMNLLSVAGGSVSPTSDVYIRIKQIRVFGETSYASSGASTLKASDVIGDALSRSTVLLSADRSGITATSLNIPEYAPNGPKTAREAWLAVDAFHDWVHQVDTYWRPIYKPKPAAPVLEIGSWSPGELNDTSANSGDEIYNQVLVSTKSPDGVDVRVRRGQTGGALDSIASPTPTNPSFDVDTTGWTALAGTLTRSTSVFDTTPAALHVTGSNPAVDGAFAGTFRRGKNYVLIARCSSRTADGIVGLGEIAGYFGDLSGEFSVTAVAVPALDTWFDVRFPWAPSKDTSSVSLRIFSGSNALVFGASAPFYVDSLRLYVSRPTLVDRRGFTRAKELPISAALPADLVAANIIADTWLTGHKTTPFKGTRTLAGDGSIRDLQTGQNAGLHTLGLKTMELIRFSDHIDPDSGGLGRDGRMTKVAYNHAEDTAEVTIDNSRASFEALLARFAVVTGGS